MLILEKRWVRAPWTTYWTDPFMRPRVCRNLPYQTVDPRPHSGNQDSGNLNRRDDGQEILRGMRILAREQPCAAPMLSAMLSTALSSTIHSTSGTGNGHGSSRRPPVLADGFEKPRQPANRC